jgi:UDP-glucose 4-epimerase
LNDPSLAAVSLFNYVDARDAADFVVGWVERADAAANGEVFFVGAADALALTPLDRLLPYPAAEVLTGTAPAFSSRHATDRLGWAPTRSWRTELAPDQLALLSSPASTESSLP